jgi:hypothetical protein
MSAVGIPSGMSMQPGTSAALPHTSLRIKAMRTADTLEPIVGTRGAVITTFDLLGKLKWQVLPLCTVTGVLGMLVQWLFAFVATRLELDLSVCVGLGNVVSIFVNVFAVGAVFVLADDVVAGDVPRSSADALRASLEFLPRIALIAVVASTLWLPITRTMSANDGIAVVGSLVVFPVWLWMAPLAAMTVAVIIAEDTSVMDAARRAMGYTRGVRLRFWVLTVVLAVVMCLFAAISMIPLTFAPAPLAMALGVLGPLVIASLLLATSALGWYVLYVQARQQERRATPAT